MINCLRVLLLIFTTLPFDVVSNETIPNETIANETPVVMVDSLEETIDLSPYLEYIEDSDFSITYEDIANGTVESLWQLNKKKVFIGENINSRYWFRINIKFLKEQ